MKIKVFLFFIGFIFISSCSDWPSDWELFQAKLYPLLLKTYKISEKFNKNMMKIGLMWLSELRKPPLSHRLTK